MLAVLPIRFLWRALSALEMVFVDDYAHASTPVIFKAADHAAVAIDLHIAARADHFTGKENRKVDARTDGDVAIHGEQNAVGGNVLSLRLIAATVGFEFHWQMQRKARSALHFGIVPCSLLP